MIGLRQCSSMEHAHLIKELLDFHEGRERFEERKEHTNERNIHR
jgi:hypothetical protein